MWWERVRVLTMGGNKYRPDTGVNSVSAMAQVKVLNTLTEMYLMLAGEAFLYNDSLIDASEHFVSNQRHCYVAQRSWESF